MKLITIFLPTLLAGTVQSVPPKPQSLPSKAQSVQNDGKPHAFKNKQGVFRFEVHPKDRWADDVKLGNPNERSEIAFPQRFAVGQTFRVAFDMKTDALAASKYGWLIVGQIHTTPPAGEHPSPPVRQVFEKGKFSIVVQYQAPDGTKPQKRVFVDPNFAAKNWHHFAYTVRFGLPEGGLTVVRDGIQIVDYHGPIGYPVELGAYFKAGIYRPHNPLKTVAQFKNVVISGE
jgi:hypothetical protein